MSNKKLNPTQIKLKKVLKPIVEGILKEIDDSKSYKMSFRDKTYTLGDNGEINGSSQWRVLGLLPKYNSSLANLVKWDSIKTELEIKPEIKGYLYQIDHGSRSVASGQFAGKIPVAYIWKS